MECLRLIHVVLRNGRRQAGGVRRRSGRGIMEHTTCKLTRERQRRRAMGSRRWSVARHLAQHIGRLCIVLQQPPREDQALRRGCRVLWMGLLQRLLDQAHGATQRDAEAQVGGVRDGGRLDDEFDVRRPRWRDVSHLSGTPTAE